jgi:hypothetical protein
VANLENTFLPVSVFQLKYLQLQFFTLVSGAGRIRMATNAQVKLVV